MGVERDRRIENREQSAVRYKEKGRLLKQDHWLGRSRTLERGYTDDTK